MPKRKSNSSADCEKGSKISNLFTAAEDKKENENKQLSTCATFEWCSTYPGSIFTLSDLCRKKDSWNFKIVSWNINGLRAWIKNGGKGYLMEEEPDVMGVQEIKCSPKDIPQKANVKNYKNYWNSAEKPGYAGTGVYSRTQPIAVTYGLNDSKHNNEGRIITVEYEKFFFLSIYVPNSGQRLERLDYRTNSWDRALCEFIKKIDLKKPVIVSGDLNVAHNEIDLANPESNHKSAGFTDGERNGFTKLLADADLVDTYRHFYPDREKAYTFWSARRNARASNNGWRLDYFLVSRRFLPHVVDQEIRCAVLGSDHCPLVLYLNI